MAVTTFLQVQLCQKIWENFFTSHYFRQSENFYYHSDRLMVRTFIKTNFTILKIMIHVAAGCILLLSDKLYYYKLCKTSVLYFHLEHEDDNDDDSNHNNTKEK